MTSQVDVFADRFPDRHRLTLGYDVAVQGFDNAIRVFAQDVVTQGHPRRSLRFRQNKKCVRTIP